MTRTHRLPTLGLGLLLAAGALLVAAPTATAGSPSMVGPIQVTWLPDGSLRLDWTAPKDTGGAPIDHYVVEKFARGEWTVFALPTSPTASDASPDGMNSIYQIGAVNGYGLSSPQRTMLLGYGQGDCNWFTLDIGDPANPHLRVGGDCILGDLCTQDPDPNSQMILCSLLRTIWEALPGETEIAFMME